MIDNHSNFLAARRRGTARRDKKPRCYFSSWKAPLPEKRLLSKRLAFPVLRYVYLAFISIYPHVFPPRATLP